MAILRGPDYVFEFANEPYIEIVGRRPILGTPVLDALPELADQGVKELLDRVRHSGSAVYRQFLPSCSSTAGAGGAAEEAFFKFVYQPILDERAG